MKNFKKNVMYATVAVLALSGVTVKSNIFSDTWQKAKKDPAKAIGIGLGTAAVLGTAGYGAHKAYKYKKDLKTGQPFMGALKQDVDEQYGQFRTKAGEFADKARTRYTGQIKPRGQELYGQARGQVRAFGQDRGLIKPTVAEGIVGARRVSAWKGKGRGFATRYGF